MGQSPNRQPYPWLRVLLALVTMFTLGIGAIVLHYVEARLVAASGESLCLAAAEIADKLSRLLFERYVDVALMARTFSLRANDGTYLNEDLVWMRKSYSPFYQWLGVANQHGSIVAATDQASVGLDMSKQVWFQSVRDGRTVHVGDAQPDEIAGGMEAISFTAPITGPEGKFLGAVTTRMAVAVLEDTLTQTIRAFQDRQGFLGNIEYQFMTYDGNVFVDSDLAHKGNLNFKRMRLPSALLSEVDLSGYVEEENLRRHVPVVTGYARILGYRDFPGLQWTVLVRVDRSDILIPIREILWKIGAAGLAVGLPLLGLLLWATGRVRKEHLHAQQESARAGAAEALLLQTQERLHLALKAGNVGLWTWDLKTNEVYLSESWKRQVGYVDAELLNRFGEFESRLHPEDRDSVLQRVTTFIKNPVSDYEEEYRLRHKDGAYRWMFTRADVIKDAEGQPAWLMGCNVDITERKHAEEVLRKTEAQLRQSHKMEAVGKLAGGVAHEFNNLLTVMTGYCEFLLLGLGLHDARRKEVTLIKQAAEQAKVLTQQLLALSRQQLYRPRAVNLNESVMNAGTMLRALLGETVTIQTVLDPAQGYVKADPEQIEQVLVNLALNARDAMPEGGQLTIRTRNVDSSSGQADSTSSGLLEASVLLEFSDTGCGMDAETKARIFEPFITTEELGKGRWLGLAPVHGIVQQNGGSIEVDSTPGKGTTVRIYLRRIAPDAETGTATVGGIPAVSSQGPSRRSR